MSLFAERVLSEWIVTPSDAVMSQRRVDEIKWFHRQAVLSSITGVGKTTESLPFQQRLQNKGERCHFSQNLLCQFNIQRQLVK